MSLIIAKQDRCSIIHEKACFSCSIERCILTSEKMGVWHVKQSYSSRIEKRTTCNHYSSSNRRRERMEKKNCSRICRRSVWEHDPSGSAKMIRIYRRVSTDKQDLDAQNHGIDNYLRVHNITPDMYVIYDELAIPEQYLRDQFISNC